MSKLYDGGCVPAVARIRSAYFARMLVAAAVMFICAGSVPAFAQNNNSMLLVAGPRTPESLDQEYPPTEASHEARRNIYERLLAYAQKADASGVAVENF